MAKSLSQIFRSRNQDAEDTELSLDNPVASPKNFAHWLLSNPDINTNKISRRRLLCLYAEFCDYFVLLPWPLGRFDRSLKLAGFQRVRLSTPGRPWVYCLQRPGVPCPVKKRHIGSVSALPKRRAK